MEPTAELHVRHLQALVAVVEEGTFTDAAIRLRTSQPAVSRSLAALEAILGVRLVERTTRSAVPTPAGLRCYRAAATALLAVGEVVAAATGEPRPLRLGYAWSALGVHTTAILQGWRTRHPDVPLELHRIDGGSAGLLRDRVDVLVLRGSVPAESGLAVRHLFEEARFAALPTGHPLAHRTELSLSDLSGETLVLAGNGLTDLRLWPADSRPEAQRPVPDVDEWVTEIAGGSAVGVTSRSTVDHHPHPGIRYLPLVDAPQVAVSLAWLTARQHPAIPAFVALAEELTAPPR